MSGIPDEAVEAAARGMFAEEQCDRRQKLDVEANWRGRLNDRDRDEYRRLSRAALEAAAPHLMANAVAYLDGSVRMITFDPDASDYERGFDDAVRGMAAKTKRLLEGKEL